MASPGMHAAMGSMLLTAEVPSFSSAGVCLTPHHLVSAPFSYSSSFPHYKLLLERPTTTPYQSTARSDLTAALPETQRQAKRRRLEPAADWTTAQHRAHQDKVRFKAEAKGRTEVEEEGRHAEVVDGLRAGWGGVTEAWLGAGGVGWMGEVGEVVEWTDKGESVNEEVDWVGLGRVVCEAGELEPLRVGGRLAGEADVAGAELIGRVVHNSTADTTELRVRFPVRSEDDAAGRFADKSVDGDATRTPSLATVVVPPGSAFLLSTFDSFSRKESPLAFFVEQLAVVDLVILDPPWPNASVARSNSYGTFDPYALGRLNLKSLLGDRPALVAIWLTNKVKYRRLVTDKLFPQWGIAGGAAGEWHWVKITDGPVADGQGGEPVWDWDSTHRRCYEGLVIGQYNPGGDHSFPALPAATTFLSTPLGHSRKPVLLDLLRPYLPLRAPGRPPNVLELFARTAMAGPEAQSDESGRGVWVGVGNEACKFNVVDQAGMSGVRGWLRSGGGGTRGEDGEGGDESERADGGGGDG